LCGAVLISLGLINDSRLCGQDADPVSDSNSYIFSLKLGGTPVAEYTECSGLGSSNAVMENAIVNDWGVAEIEKTPGLLEWHNITLKRAGLNGTEVWSWREAMETGDANEAFRDGAIVMLSAGPPSQWLAEWTFQQGWAASLTFDGGVEKLIIVHNGLQRVTPGMPPGRPSR